MNTEHPLTRNFLELQRKTAKGYTCPVCEQTYHEDLKIWNHGVRNHPQYLGNLGKAEGVRKRFRQEAIEKAQQKAIITRKAGTIAAELISPPKPPSRSSKINGRNVRDGNQETGSPTQSSAQEYSRESEKRIDDIGSLSLEHAEDQKRKDTGSSVNNPRKRGPEGHSGSPGPPVQNYQGGPMTAKVRHGNTLSENRDVEFSRSHVPAEEVEFRRGFSGAKQPLYDPNTDTTNNAQNVRRETKYGYANPTQGNYPTRDSRPSYQESHLARKGVGYPDIQGSFAKPYVHQFKDQAYHGRKEPSVSVKDPGDDSGESPSEDNLPEDKYGDYRGSQDAQPELLLQPETRPISHEQLVVEVKGIYAGLVMVEAKCIDIDERQSAAAQEKDPSKRPELKDDQWQSLIALHKQLLHEHHDFFLASQHPSASTSLSRLAAKYSMPARMWRHGIHAFLEVLRHRLPESLEHMLAFVYIAYSMMALLYETVPAFEDTWIECLGDLGRYRMAIEDDEPKDREVWSNVAKFWYNKASDKTPNVGRLYHHLAILARPYTLEQLSLYTRSLICVTPFESAKGSIMTLFNPILQNKDISQRRSYSLETLFIMAHALLFTSKISGCPEQITATIEELKESGLFEKYISKAAARFKEFGVYMAMPNIAAIFGYGYANDGKSKSSLRIAFESAQCVKEKTVEPPTASQNDPVQLSPSTKSLASDVNSSMPNDSDSSRRLLSWSSRLAFQTLAICLKYPNDSNVYPLVHVYLVFFWSLLIVQSAIEDFEQDAVSKTIEKDIPWDSICVFLNTLAADPEVMTSNVWSEQFPWPSKEIGRPLPEDYIMRGQIFTQWYFPTKDKDINDWFSTAMVDEDERLHDLPSMALPRKERMLWLGIRISSANRWICYDKEKQSFLTTDYTNGGLPSNANFTAQDVTMS